MPEPEHRRRPGAHRLSSRGLLGSGAALGSLGLLAACSNGAGGGEHFQVEGPPRKGGILRVGLTGGSAADTADAHSPVNNGDIARTVNLYDPLLMRDDDYVLRPRLATSFKPNAAATVWTATLRTGVRFSDGSPLEPEDVVYTFKRITDKKDPKVIASGLTMLDDVVKTGPHTVEFRLSDPNSVLDDQIGQYAGGIVPRGYDPKKPIGTGPFVLESFAPGESTVLKPNPHYWGKTGPFVDEVRLLSFNDDDAVINALLSSQVDAVSQIPLALVEVIGSDERMAILNSKTGRWMPFTMRVDRPPFDDVRVRQAFRLVVDRQQMIDQVLSGFGQLGNDMYGILDPAYPKDIPQRTQDIAKAKELLAAAGHGNGLKVELVTAPIQSGVVEAAQVFAQQAKAADIDVSIRRVDSTTFFGDDYLQWDFAQDFWNSRNILGQTVAGTVKDAPFNETHWDNPRFERLAAQARGELDEAKRAKLIRQGQEMLFDEGGYIIWGFANQVDAYQKYVAGMKENATGIPLGGYNFNRVWIGEVS